MFLFFIFITLVYYARFCDLQINMKYMFHFSTAQAACCSCNSVGRKWRVIRNGLYFDHAILYNMREAVVMLENNISIPAKYLFLRTLCVPRYSHVVTKHSSFMFLIFIHYMYNFVQEIFYITSDSIYTF